jgi:CBS domain-containing protein
LTAQPFVTVREVMSTAPQVVDGLATVREAVIHAVAEQVIGRNRSPDRTNVYEIMSKPVVSLDADMNIKYAARLLFRFGLSRAVVIENGDLVGLVTLRDLVLRYIAETSA